MFGIGALLAKPAVLIGILLTGILAAAGFYFWFSQNQIAHLQTKLAYQDVQIQQNIKTISDLDDRLKLVQQLNDNFNKAVNGIRDQQAATAKALAAYNLKQASIQKPREAELFITKRTNDVFDTLNSLSRETLDKTK